MFSQAFVRSQLKRLDEINALRVRNCRHLTRYLGEIPGVETPRVPPERETVYYNYVVGFDPQRLGLAVSAAELRDRVMEALKAEGVAVGLWQRRTVPAQDVFQNPIGYGKGCPWKCRDRKVDYDPENYPVANAFLESHCYVYDINPPNDLELMDLYVQAFRKVMGGLDQILG
jgi:perosamine synthetase